MACAGGCAAARQGLPKELLIERSRASLLRGACDVLSKTPTPLYS